MKESGQNLGALSHPQLRVHRWDPNSLVLSCYTQSLVHLGPRCQVFPALILASIFGERAAASGDYSSAVISPRAAL